MRVLKYSLWLVLSVMTLCGCPATPQDPLDKPASPDQPAPPKSTER